MADKLLDELHSLFPSETFQAPYKNFMGRENVDARLVTLDRKYGLT